MPWWKYLKVKDKPKMRITRLFTNGDGDSMFETIEIKLTPAGEIGSLSRRYAVQDLIFRETGGDYNYDFHNAPEKQFIIMLDGEIEIETSLGVKRNFRTGDILLVEDVTGKGHRSRSIDGAKRRSLFITLGDSDVKTT
jgi:hypothetical protein